jgi:hypothetical protein
MRAQMSGLDRMSSRRARLKSAKSALMESGWRGEAMLMLRVTDLPEGTHGGGRGYASDFRGARRAGEPTAVHESMQVV